MFLSDAHRWLDRGERRKRVILCLKQPMTAKQLAKGTRLSRTVCTRTLTELSLYQLVLCLNDRSRRSRLYWLTEVGLACQRVQRELRSLPPPTLDFPIVSWPLYGWCCYSHRAAVIKALTEPMQAAEIRRRARSLNTDLRISSNNVRDVLKLLADRSIVSSSPDRKSGRPRYSLTTLGKRFQLLLFGAE